jgi:NAD(P)-dependent dehydrogenase (short-subunit alcohol dehydrogenase family)
MKKQTIIITGASSGIGKEIAKYFLERGDNVVINSATAKKLEKVYHELGAGPNLAIVVGDVSDKQTGQQLLATAIEKFGSADVLVNNAGILELQPLMERDEQTWRHVLDTNLTGMFLCCQQVGQHLIQQQQGAIINMASHWSLIGVSQAVAYAASKSGVTGFTRALAVEWARYHITVNAVAPGLTATAINAEARNDARMRDMMLRQIPLRRFGDVDEVGHLVAYLSSDAARFITGQTIVMDGGQIIA